MRAEINQLRVEMHQLNTRTIMWMVGTMVALNATSTTLILALG